MSTRKQEILVELMHWLICTTRGLQTIGPWRRLCNGRAFRRAFADLNLIHRIPHSILDEGYVDNDISFINSGIRIYWETVGSEIEGYVAALLVKFIEGVPEIRRKDLTWFPPQKLLNLAQRHKESDAQWPEVVDSMISRWSR